MNRPTRRRFLTVCAAFAATPAAAWAESWQGRAFGAEAKISLRGPRRETAAALAEARGLIRQFEALFSLYDPGSDLVRLNRRGSIRPAPHFRALVEAADFAYRLTEGLFDPTVQPLWLALAKGGDTSAARAAIGWDKVHIGAGAITLGPGQGLTFNGIAQGYATDAVAAMLQARGFSQALVNIGEYRGIGGPWKLGLEDPSHGALGLRTLNEGAIATSSALATPLGANGHILHKAGAPQWSTVSVEADDAWVADALSTALILAGPDQVRRIRRAPGVRRITLVDASGDLMTV